MKTTKYFVNEVMRKRPYLTIEMCKRVIENPYRRDVQSNGRIRFWGKIDEYGGKYLRVITLHDAKTIHNAFFDRGFKQ